MGNARKVALVLLAALVVGVSMASIADAGTFYYKPPGRMKPDSLGIGGLHSNYANWMHVGDCGGITNGNCNHEIWMQDRDGTRQWTRYASGKDVWLGRDQDRRGGVPVCTTHTTSSQWPYTACYQGY